MALPTPKVLSHTSGPLQRVSALGGNQHPRPTSPARPRSPEQGVIHVSRQHWALPGLSKHFQNPKARFIQDTFTNPQYVSGTENTEVNTARWLKTMTATLPELLLCARH